MLFFAWGWPAPVRGAPAAPTVYVSGDGTGDFNCDGTADEVEINAALAYDAGYWLSSYAGEPRPNGWRINIGAYGNTAEASKSLFTGCDRTWTRWR